VWFRRHTWPVAKRPARAPFWRIAGSLALLALSSWVLVRLSSIADLKRALAESRAVGPSLLLLLAMPAVRHFVKTLGWRSLLPPASRPPLTAAYVTFVAAQGMNEIGFSVMGEPLKVWALPPEARAGAVRAVLADNLAALAALLAVIAALARLGWVTLPCVGIALLVLWRGRREGWSSLLFAFLAHCLGKLWLVVEIALGLHFLGQPALNAAPTLALAWLGAAAVGAPVPGQLGVVEAALVHTGTSLGIATSSLLALGLVRRVRSLLWIVLGLVFAARIINRTPEGTRHASTAAA